MQNNPFLDSLGKFKAGCIKLEETNEKLLSYRADLEKNINKTISARTLSKGLSATPKENELSKKSEKLILTIQNKIKKQAEDWDNSSFMRQLSDEYSDKIILLVFGKVNAGKSSFSNFIAELFPPEDIKYFRFDKGKIKYFNGTFKEGVVETTASIQGVELGHHLVLLDTPGLHSVTDENGELTRKFTDSADAILWLTPSDSPGQVQELKDLKDELDKNKPLLPIITRSDTLMEELDERNEMKTFLHNKTKDNRKLQEDDVYKRVSEIQNSSISITPPLSISVHTFRNSNRSDEAESSSGFTRLYKSLAEILDEAKTYKVNKASQQVVNYLDNKVLTPLQQDVIPQIKELKKASNNAINNLQQKKQKISSEVTASVCAEIPRLIDNHKSNQDKTKISSELNILVERELNTLLQHELQEYSNTIHAVSSSFSSEDLGDFESITVDIEQVKGSAAKATSAGIATVVGAAAGSFIPGVGTLIGSTIGGVFGGLLGSTAGDFFIETETITEQIGIGTEAIINQTTESTKSLLPELVEKVIEDIIHSIHPMQHLAESVFQVIVNSEKQINQLRKNINV